MKKDTHTLAPQQSETFAKLGEQSRRRSGKGASANERFNTRLRKKGRAQHSHGGLRGK